MFCGSRQSSDFYGWIFSVRVPSLPILRGYLPDIDAVGDEGEKSDYFLADICNMGY